MTALAGVPNRRCRLAARRTPLLLGNLTCLRPASVEFATA
jgi:hypothetical protein